MPRRHLHLERLATIPQILCHEHCRLLANQQSGAVRVAADVVGADGEVGALEAFDAVHVETLIENAVFDDAVAFAGGHGAGS